MGQSTSPRGGNRQPLGGAYIIFNPVAPSGQSSTLSDESGKYTLQYPREHKGAEIGEHTVRIPSGSNGNPDSDPPQPRVAEKLPAKYHARSDLKASVKSGANVIDFPLESATKSGQAARK